MVILTEASCDRGLFVKALDFGERQLKRLIANHPGFYPMYTHQGRWKHELPLWTRWCEGFLPGMMWIFHGRHEEDSPCARWWLDQAIRYTAPLEPRKLDCEVHDLGFLFMPTYYHWLQATGADELREVLIQAGRTMALRFREKGQYLRSFVSEDSLFIDIMMNVGIVFYSALATGDRKLLDIAVRHCLTTRRVLVRGDGSTAHEGLFDLETGEFLRQTTHQGYRGDSCWSRGLAWALYGFVSSYGYTQDPRFLQTATSCADFYIANTPSDGVPPWDYDAPSDGKPLLDTSAAAIAAGGLLRLSSLCSDPECGRSYEAAANRILTTLCQKHLATEGLEWEGILKGGVYHLHKRLGVSESVMWGEYFFVEALDLALRQQRSPARI
jgi:unsaturated chondroitin disaccharide hydrolase